MGVDLHTHRCRIGTFFHHHGADVVMLAFHINFSIIAKIVGAVSFIRILLLMAGIEQNPGPTDQFIFRYQFLLIEVGTKILRQLFDKLVGNDINNYLNMNPKQDKQLKFMANKGLINDDQKKVLPPIDKTPNSENFDITLLSCLLRNICGLRSYTDGVWKTPVPAGDLSLEADITRLRDCRNNLFHTETVFIDAKEFNTKWDELNMILNRLNKSAGITGLASLICVAQDMAIDERLQEEFDDLLKSWGEMDKLFDHGIGEVMMEVTNVKHAISGVKSDTVKIQENQEQFKVNLEKQARALGEVKSDINELKENVTQQHQPIYELSDIQKRLIDFYKQCHNNLPVIPFSKNKDDDLLLAYKFPTMHVVEETKDTKQITCYEDVFLKEYKSCNEIYMTGDAGVGKTSFCQHLCLMWSKAKCGQMLEKKYEYVSKFDCVFYINLRDTEDYHVVNMIKECFFEHLDINIIGHTLDAILMKTNCLIIFDGLDEWSPKMDGKKTHELPKRLYSENCVYLTTCRPYRIENVRLARKDVDHQISISGIHGKSLKSYIENILNFMNRQNYADKKYSDFESDIQKCGLTNEISIPIIGSHLVVLWYEKTLDGMTRALIYANILDMLFQRAEERKVSFPLPTTSISLLPDTLSGLVYLKEYVSLLYNVCHLSFCSMFKQDENVTNLVFTRRQLQSEPFCFSAKEIDFLCKIGILSTNEVFGCYLVEKLKISFIHKSYLEFFAALFISSFDSKNLFKDVTKTWKRLNDFVQYENFFLLLAGFSLNSIKILFENIYLALSEDLTLCRRNALFHYNKYPYRNQIKLLQRFVANFFEEVSRSTDKTVELRMDDFIFDENSTNVDILRKLLLLNTTNVKSLHCDESKYFDEFDQIKNLQCINIVKVSSADYVKFTQCMLQNRSTLNTVCIEGDYKPLISHLLVSNLHHLTSLSLCKVKIQHNSLCYLVKFLSNNLLIENIKLSSVSCVDHQDDDSKCPLTLNLQKHTKLTSLCLRDVNILCDNVNNSSLQSITLFTLSERIVRLCYSDLFNSIKDSQLEHLDIRGFYDYILDYNTLKTLTSTVKTLPCIKLLELWYMNLPDDVLLHPDVTQVKIKLDGVTMSRQCFHCFVESVNKKSEIKVTLVYCKITSDDGETHRKLSEEESVYYMSEHLQSFSTINITCKDKYVLHIETTKCE